MVSWYADGSVSGYTVVGNNTNVIDLSLPGLTRDIFKLSSNGSVDTNGITRLQYDVGDSYYRKTIDAVARLKFTQAEITASTGGWIGATVAFAPASAFASLTRNPTPTEIVAAATYAYHASAVNGTPTANQNYEIILPGYKPPANQKWWVVVYGSRWPTGASSGPATPGADIALGGLDFAGRAISVWTNRKPPAPTIKTPGSESVYGSGSLFDLTFVSTDADRVSTRVNKQDADLAGVQVQYAAQTTDGSAPVWMDLPVATKDLNPGVGVGWYIEGSAFRDPVSDVKNGMFDFWLNWTMKIRCGPTSQRTPGAGMLPEGAWLLRMRTFDYGHPFPRWRSPLGDETKTYTPDTYPDSNTSPWSNVLKITVSPQVPAPVPLSPVKGVAVTDDKDVTLRWKYRNTVNPPNPQREREVRIRKAGGDWVTLVSGNGSETELNVEGSQPPAPIPPVQYAVDGGFENGTVGGWQTLNPEGLANKVGGARSGQRYLRLNDAVFNSSPPGYLYRSYPLNPDHQYMSLTMWQKRPVSNSYEQVVSLTFVDDNFNPVSRKSVAAPPGGGWSEVVIKNLKRAAGATQILIEVVGIPPNAGQYTVDMGVDDVSLLGSVDPIPDLPPVYNPFTIEPNTYYEWQVRVVDTANVASEWSDIAGFWVVPTPAKGGAIPDPNASIEGATLGCGTYTVSISRRGGLIHRGYLDSISSLSYNRVRDDISEAKVTIKDWSQDCGAMLAELEPWAYEVVIHRHTVFGTDRVWEGPITLLTYDEGSHEVVIHAKDIMVLAYRRIVEQAMNDSGDAGGDTVTSRAARVMANVLAPDDPNVLEHMVVIDAEDDPRQYRNMPPFSRYAFEEIDDMASNSGLDYTVVGRRVILWGTKNRVGTLPEFRDSDLGAKPIVSVYGMSMANRYSVSDGQGIHGEADRLNSQGKDPKYGLIDMLSSTWASEAGPEEGTYTEAAKETIRKSFAEAAERSIASRYPAPVVVRVPDNTTLNQTAPISIQHLVPGVIIPLRSTGLRKVSGNQKLDEVKVVYDAKSGEKISITLSPFNRPEVASEGLDEGQVAEQ